MASEIKEKLYNALKDMFYTSGVWTIPYVSVIHHFGKTKLKNGDIAVIQLKVTIDEEDIDSIDTFDSLPLIELE